VQYWSRLNLAQDAEPARKRLSGCSVFLWKESFR
jgi:hypothetical protein